VSLKDFAAELELLASTPDIHVAGFGESQAVVSSASDLNKDILGEGFESCRVVLDTGRTGPAVEAKGTLV
jgi:hypothetical protein